MKASFELENYLLAHEHKAQISLCNSGLPSLSLETLASLGLDLTAQLQKIPLAYHPPQGLPPLRRLIAQQYAHLNEHGVMIFHGACEAIYCGLQALLTPGDHSVIVTPCYQSLKTVPASFGSITEVPMRLEENWALPLDRIEEAIDIHTRLLVVNIPNNPTGALPTLAEFEALIALVRKHNLWLFCDEVYRGMELNPADRLPPVTSVYERGISIGSFSKLYGLPGIRIGWLATQAVEIMPQLLNHRHYTTISSNTLGEHIAFLVLQHEKALTQSALQQLRTNFAQFQDWMSEQAGWLDWVLPKAGCLCFPRVKNQTSADILALMLLEQHQVLILPGSLYDWPASYFRIGFAHPAPPTAWAQLAQVARELNGMRSGTG